MIKVRFYKATGTSEIIVEGTTTPAQIRDEQGVDFGTTLFLNGCALDAGTVNQPLANLINGAEECSMSVVTKTTNAA